MELFGETIERELPDLAEQGVRARFSAAATGRRTGCRRRWRRSSGRRPIVTGCDLWIAFDYGGRAEIVEPLRTLVREGVDADAVNEEVVSAAPARPEMPDPDL